MNIDNIKELRQAIAKAMMKLNRVYSHYCNSRGCLQEVHEAAAELQDLLADAEECE